MKPHQRKMPVCLWGASLRAAAGVTLPELIVALGVGSLLLAAAAALSVYGARTFAAIGSFTDLDARNRAVLDELSWKVRGASAVLACQSNLPVRSLTLANPDASHTITLTWDSDSRTFVLAETGGSARTVLNDCDEWNFALYSRAPSVGSTSLTFSPTGILSDCHLIDMTWRCSRPVPAEKIVAQSVETARMSLRNAR